MGVGRPSRRVDLLVGGFGVAHSEVLGDRSREQFGILGNRRHVRPQLAQPHIAHVYAVDQDPPRGDVEEPWDELDHGRLAGAGRPHQGHHLAGVDHEVDVGQHLYGAVVVAEADALEGHPALDLAQRHRVLGLVELAGGIEQLEDAS